VSAGADRCAAVVEQPPEQLRYARWLEAGTRAGLAALVLLFVIYALGLLAPHVPVQRLPELWVLPAGEFLQTTASPTGWGWVELAGRGDYINLFGIVALAGCSLLALAALIPGYLQRGDRLFAALCVTEIAVVLLAASGLLTAGH
jgi:hypothetical protein